MIPSALLLSNFRSFGGPELTTIQLRPITLLFGRNGGGKSAIVRSLPLIADSLMDDRDKLDALDLEHRLEPFDLDFDSLRWKGRAETDEKTITVGLRWDEDPTLREVTWAIAEEDAWHRLVVDRLSIEGAQRLSAKWMLKQGEEADRALTYALRIDDAPSRFTRLAFRGLSPESTGQPAPLGELEARLHAFASSVVWLQSLRPAPKRFTRWKGATRWSLQPDGHDAPIVLGAEPALLKEVSSWYEAHLGTELVVDEPRKREVRTLIRNRSRSAYDIDLVDTGEGLSECLAVLTALAMARRHKERGGPSILAIEEPGSHLHPDLQRALTQRICEVAKDARPCIVLETHSEMVMRTVVLNVVNGTLRPEDVIMYWVKQREDGKSIADPVEIAASGKLSGNWPPDAFQQDIAIAADIQDAREER